MAQATASPAIPTQPQVDHAVPSTTTKAPTKARRLTPAMITAATGEETLEKLEELEMIFGGVSEIGGLDRCTRLRTLTLIDCGLRRISNLEPVSYSLVKLCLCDQGLKKMENLCVPGLKELYLHQNKIIKIDGLQGCPSLRRLWLFSNRITEAEGLHHCGALRELWLHDNKITKAAGLESLVHLKNLGLAGNPIAGLRHLSGLRGLPSLAELTLDDIHFGACPVVCTEGYRDFVLCFLRQVRRLDGLEVAEADRAEAAAKYEEEALAYQEKLEEIERKKIHEIQQAERARDGGAKHGSEVKAEMMRAFRGLEGLVKEGRAAMAEQRSRQEQVQASNFRALENSLTELQKQYCREVDRRVKIEATKGNEEERLFAALEKRTCLEREYALLVARQQSGLDREGMAVQELSDHSPDLQRLRAEVLAKQRSQSGHQVELMNVLRACRLYNRRLCDDFLSAAGESSPIIRLYLCLSGSDAEEVCRAGLAGLNQASVVLHPDPKQAATATTQGRAPYDPTQESRSRAEGSGKPPPTKTKTQDGAALEKSDSIETFANPRKNTPDARAIAGARTACASSREPRAPILDSGSGNSNNNSSDGVSHSGDGVDNDTAGLMVILQLAVVLLEEEVDVVQLTPGVREGYVPGMCFRPEAGADRGNGETRCQMFLPAAVQDRAGVSGRVLRVAFAPEAVAAAVDGAGVGDRGQQEQHSSCYVLPARCFARVLPEFHLLCASGSLGEDRRALEDALAELSRCGTSICQDSVLGAGLETDMLSQLEAKMQDEVAAYLDRMKQDVTQDEAFKFQATDADMRRKAATLAAVRAGVDEERALQEALLHQDPRR